MNIIKLIMKLTKIHRVQILIADTVPCGNSENSQRIFSISNTKKKRANFVASRTLEINLIFNFYLFMWIVKFLRFLFSLSSFRYLKCFFLPLLGLN